MFYSQAHFVNVYCYIRPALVKMDISSFPSHLPSLSSYFCLQVLTASYCHFQLPTEGEKKKCFWETMQKKKVYSLLNLLLKFNYITLIRNSLMAFYRVRIRCSHTVSAEQKFLWQNATSFTGELVCSAHLSFDRFSPATTQDRRMSPATLLAPSLPLRGVPGTLFFSLGPRSSPRHLVSLAR